MFEDVSSKSIERTVVTTVDGPEVQMKAQNLAGFGSSQAHPLCFAETLRGKVVLQAQCSLVLSLHFEPSGTLSGVEDQVVRKRTFGVLSCLCFQIFCHTNT